LSKPTTTTPILGDLERSVLEHLWSGGPSDVKAVHKALGVRRGISSNTVQSALERLYRKGLLSREKSSHAFVYAPAISREELGARLVHDVVSSVLGGEAQQVLSAFVEFAERGGDETLARLEELIAARRAERAKQKGRKS
jgi:predicted transcriptional regulator